MSITPKLIIVGGPNGSGKTTFATEFLTREKFIYLSADAIAYELNPKNPTNQAIEAGRIFSKRLSKYLNEKENLIIESTLSGLSLKKYLDLAKSLNYQLDLIYIFLDSPKLCNARIEERVKKGGHFVPPNDVTRRFYRSQQNFWHFYRQLIHSWQLIYNSGESFVFVAIESEHENCILNNDLFNLFQLATRKLK